MKAARAPIRGDELESPDAMFVDEDDYTFDCDDLDDAEVPAAGRGLLHCAEE